MSDKLAIDGGTPVRTAPVPARAHFGAEEKAIVNKLFDECIAQGAAPGYGGAYEKQYDQEFAQFMGGGFADGVNSGSNALFVALGALQLEPFSEVIVPPITDQGGTMPVIFVGCVPVVADADPRTFNTCAEAIKPMITERTRAIVVAHIAGDPVDMDPVLELAQKHNLYVVEDCAQSHGAKYKGRYVGSLGHIGAFSTMFGKHHCTGGQGGVVFTRDEKLFWQARRFADRGKPFNIENAAGNVTAGLNCNLSDLGAAIGSAQLKKLPSFVEKRRKVAAALNDGLKNMKALAPAWLPAGAESSYWFMKFKFNAAAVRVDKVTFCKAVTAEGAPLFDNYRHIPAESPWFKNQATFGKSGFPWTCSDYKGPRTPQFKIDNAIKATDDLVILFTNESFGPQDIADTLAAFAKVEKAYAK